MPVFPGLCGFVGKPCMGDPDEGDAPDRANKLRIHSAQLLHATPDHSQHGSRREVTIVYVRDRRQLHPGIGLELGQQRGDMGFHRVWRDEQ